MKIAILGAGAFGTALGGILADNGYDIDYYDSRIERENLRDVVSDAKFILLAVPSGPAPYVLPYLPKEKPLIIATKGFLDAHNFAEFSDYMVLSGPGFAADIKAGKETHLTCTDARVRELFTTEFLTFDYTSDSKGVLMCGALKNIFAIRAGFLKLVPGSSECEKYITEVAEEMKALLSANEASPKTVDLACGIGDLRLTCDYPSRNFDFGLKLADNPNALPEQTVEGITALSKVKRGEIKIPEGLTHLETLISDSEKWGVYGAK